jgi:hypothetical protein
LREARTSSAGRLRQAAPDPPQKTTLGARAPEAGGAGRRAHSAGAHCGARGEGAREGAQACGGKRRRPPAAKRAGGQGGW